MKRLLIILCISLILIILQQAIFSEIEIYGSGIDLVFTFVVCYSLVRNDLEAVILALICGIIRDSFFPYIFGLNTIVFVSISYFICLIEKRIYKDTIIIPMLITFVATVVKYLIFLMFFYIVSIKISFNHQILSILPLESIYNSIISIFIFIIVKKIDSLNVMQQKWELYKRRG